MRFGIKLVAAALTLSLSSFAQGTVAKELALIISNSEYDHLKGERRIGRDHNDLVAAFTAQGYEVIEGVDLTRLEMQALVQRVDSVLDELSGIVVLCSANTVTDGTRTWILPTDIGGDSVIEASFGAPTLDMFLSLAAEKPGHGAVFVGAADVNTTRASSLTTGVGDTDIPQGVLMVSGPSDKISALLERTLLGNNNPLSSSLSGQNGISVAGFVSPDHGLNAKVIAPSAATSVSGNWVDFVAEQTLWAVADTSNSESDLREYLRRFPSGTFAQAARARLAAVTEVQRAPTPGEIEADLKLTRTQRRNLQTNLTMLGFDTNGIDGLIGRGTRAAITTWQRSQRHPLTGYLNAQQLAELDAQAATQRAVVEVEDRRFWNRTGISGQRDDLERYLAAYPGGLFVRDAENALAEMDAEQRTRIDGTAWSEAVAINTANSYRAYIAQFPDGIYKTIATPRILTLDPGGLSESEESLAAQQESRLNLNVATRMLIETRLRSSGYNPGVPDGIFDANTRKAIKKYQKDKGLNRTGYIDPATVRALLLG